MDYHRKVSDPKRNDCDGNPIEKYDMEHLESSLFNQVLHDVVGKKRKDQYIEKNQDKTPYKHLIGCTF